MVHNLCDEAGVMATYEKISFGTKVAFHRPSPYAENPAEQMQDTAG